MRTRASVAVLSLLAAGLAGTLASAGPAAADTQLEWCTPVPATLPCIESVTRNGSAITESDPTWSVTGVAYGPTVDDPSRHLSFAVMKDGTYELGSASLGTDWSIQVRLSSAFVPRVVTGKGTDTSVARAQDDGDYLVTVDAEPVTVAGQCDQSVWPWVCPENGAGSDSELWKQWDAILDVQVTDYQVWEDSAQRAAFYGMDYFTNVAATSVPPEITFDADDNPALLIRLANRHFLSDGTTVVHGHGELRIPDSFLQEVYGIPDPSTMTTAGLDPALSGTGAGTVTVTDGAGQMEVDYSGVTFSARKLRIEQGVITPTRPTQVSATRTGRHRGFVDFEPSNPRGAAVTGYRARCTSGDLVATGTADGDAGLVEVGDLRRGRGYDCRVRATSKAGPSRWSDEVRMPAKVFTG